VQVRGVLLAAYSMLDSAPGGFAGPLDHRMFAPSGAQAGAKARAGTVADGLAAP
jgi:hypothetical protein